MTTVIMLAIDLEDVPVLQDALLRYSRYEGVDSTLGRTAAVLRLRVSERVRAIRVDDSDERKPCDV